MATFSVIRNKGSHTADNPISAVPEGAHEEAENCIIRYRDVLEPRRGQKLLGQSSSSATPRTFGTSSDRSNAGTFFEGTLVHHYGTDKLTRDTGAAFSDYSGTYEPPGQQRMKFLHAASSLFFTTKAGLFVLDAVSGTPRAAGIPRAMDINRENTRLIGGPGSGWFEPDSQVAYRVVWGLKDAHGQVRLGAPSGRVLVANPAPVTLEAGKMEIENGTGFVKVTAPNHGLNYPDVFNVSPGETDIPAGDYIVAGTRPLTQDTFWFQLAGTPSGGFNTQTQTITTGAQNVALRVPIPDGITTAHFLRVYRSPMSPSVGLPPTDELFLVYEVGVTSIDLTAGFIDVIDQHPEVLLETTPLYTNPNTGDGIESANMRPPIARDVAWWQSRSWFADTTDLQRFFLSLLGVGLPAGVQNGDTITIAGQTYTAKDEPTLDGEFKVHSSGTPAQNIERTALHLINSINSNASSPVYAYYVSGDTDAPGKIVIEAKSLGQSAFAVYASRPSSWHPALTTSATGAQTSDDQRRQNGLSYSKLDQPEAVPLGNYLTVGPKQQTILRIIPLRDKLFVFPEQGGIHTVAGAVPPFRVDELDSTTWLIAPDTAVRHANQIFALTNQGVCAISDAGARIVSKDIENELLELIAMAGDKVRELAFAVSYETERQYQLWLPSGPNDTCCTQAWIYNSLLNTWTHWTAPRTWGAVAPGEDVLYLGDGDANTIRVERKAYTREDYADEALSRTITAGLGRVLTLDSVAGIEPGDLLWQSDEVHALITDVDEDASTVTTLTTEGFGAGPAQVLKAFDVRMKYAPASPAGPSIIKQWQQCTLHFRRFTVGNVCTVRFDTEKVPGESSVDAAGGGGFGMDAWGSTPWGSPSGPRNRRVGVSQSHTLGTQIRVGLAIREAWAQWALNGYSLEYAQGSERNSR